MKSQNKSKDFANHGDTVGFTLVRLMIEQLVSEGILTSEVAKQLVVQKIEPPEFKELMNRGLRYSSSLSTGDLVYARPLGDVLIPREAAIRLGSLYAKFPTKGDKAKTRDAALLTYVKSELEVMEFDMNKLDALTETPLFIKVRRRMRHLFAEFNAKDVVDNVRFGPGTTSTKSIKLNSQKIGYLLRNNGLSMPKELYEYFKRRGWLGRVAEKAHALATSYVHFGARDYVSPATVLSHNEFREEVTTVPKDALTDRTISTFPFSVTLVSVAVNRVLSEVINQADRYIEFTYQSRCSDMLDEFLKETTVIDDPRDFRESATIDLKDASGHVSWRLLQQVIDNSDVLELLKALRAEFSHLRVFIPRKETRTEQTFVRKVGYAGSRTLHSGLSFYKAASSDCATRQPEEVWEEAIQRNTWLATIVRDGRMPIFYTVSESEKGWNVEVDILRSSHAGMGSGATFPVMAALIGAIVWSTTNCEYRIFGDDLILINAKIGEVSKVISNLEAFGLVVNRQKTCKGENPIREAVGSWWMCKQDEIRKFVPFYLRMDITPLSNPPLVERDGKKVRSRCSDLKVLHYAVSMHNYAIRLKYYGIAQFFARLLATNSAVPIAHVPGGSGLFGLEVFPSDGVSMEQALWSWYSPVFSKGILVSLRHRLIKGEPSFQDGSITVERTEDISIDQDLQVAYIKIKAIKVDVYDVETPGSFVDDEVTVMTARFSQDVFANSLGVLSDEYGKREYRDWLVEANNIAKTSVDREISDRPPKDAEVFYQATCRLEIPLAVIIAWEDQATAT